MSIAVSDPGQPALYVSPVAHGSFSLSLTKDSRAHYNDMTLENIESIILFFIFITNVIL